MLTLEKIKIRLGSFELHANLTIQTSAITAIMGPSGAGKSTLLSAIAGFTDVSGRINLSGQDITNLPPSKRPLSILFQDNNLFPHMTAFQNVALGISTSLKLSQTQKSEVHQALAHVGLAEYENQKPSALSGGQQSRVALARILVRKKPLILLDEPFAALGPALKAEMLDLVTQLAKERDLTVLMISHDPSDARRIASNVVLVASGQAYAPVSTLELLDNPPEELRDYLGT